MKQRKINNFIEKHPKLKKLGLILSTIFSIWGVFLTIILIISMARSSVRNSENNIRKILNDEKPIQEAARRGDYYYLGIGDMLSEKALDSVLAWCSNNPYYNGFISGDGTWRYYNLLQDYPTPNSNLNIDNIFYISTLNNDPNTNTPSTIFNSRLLGFYSYVTNASSYRLWNYYLSFRNDGNTTDYMLCWFRFTDITGSVNISENIPSRLFNSKFVYRVNYSNPDDVIVNSKDYAFYFYGGSTTYNIFSSLINDTASIDYNEGYQIGLTEGYQIGYMDGQEDLSINGASPFALISSAFTSIADILNIKILPWLDLGTIIFTPIIVTLLIVVIKMFKG